MSSTLKWNRRPSMYGVYGKNLRETYRCDLYHTPDTYEHTNTDTIQIPEWHLSAEFQLIYDHSSAKDSICNIFCEIWIRFPHLPLNNSPYRQIQIQADSLSEAVKAAKRNTLDFAISISDKLAKHCNNAKCKLREEELS